MTKKELSQYRSIVAEIDELTERITKNTFHDAVTGSDSEFPYVQHTMSVSGMESTGDNIRMIGRRDRLLEQKRKIHDFVEAIEDSETRRIFRYRYIDGKVRPSWQWIAFKIGHHDEQIPRKKHDKFLQSTKSTKKQC